MFSHLTSLPLIKSAIAFAYTFGALPNLATIVSQLFDCLCQSRPLLIQLFAQASSLTNGAC
jgi:hypothetical protein